MNITGSKIPIKIALISIYKGFSEVIKTIRVYNRGIDAMDAIGVYNIPIRPNPKIIEISLHTPFSYHAVEALYNLSLEYNIDIYFLIRFMVRSGLGADDIRSVLRSDGEVY